ncbi:MAG: ribonuclease H-like domain-containing protein [Deltaproteobacteria bacterium]|nr:ribonuclease H-like domain-containing protein [Deltaproteobacteria bacterium]
MLKNTFCHVPGIGTVRESRLWSSGVYCWDDFIRSAATPFMPEGLKSARRYVEESIRSLENKDHQYFRNLLPSSQVWRLFPEFRDSVAYLDIETTGLSGLDNHITTISLYDGNSVSYYIYDDNLDDFKNDINKYKVLITYNGKCFDIPFIESSLKIKIDHAHVDLRYLLKNIGYTGGLKGCERQMGIDRKDLRDVDGYCAVLLWQDYVKHNNTKALETLLAYNILDTVNLETLMVIAYNAILKNTPFSETHALPLPVTPPLPFQPDRQAIERVTFPFGQEKS